MQSVTAASFGKQTRPRGVLRGGASFLDPTPLRSQGRLCGQSLTVLPKASSLANDTNEAGSSYAGQADSAAGGIELCASVSLSVQRGDRRTHLLARGEPLMSMSHAWEGLSAGIILVEKVHIPASRSLAFAASLWEAVGPDPRKTLAAQVPAVWLYPVLWLLES